MAIIDNRIQLINILLTIPLRQQTINPFAKPSSINRTTSSQISETFIKPIKIVHQTVHKLLIHQPFFIKLPKMLLPVQKCQIPFTMFIEITKQPLHQPFCQVEPLQYLFLVHVVAKSTEQKLTLVATDSFK